MRSGEQVRENVRIAAKRAAKRVSRPYSLFPEFPRFLPRIPQRYSRHSPTWPPSRAPLLQARAEARGAGGRVMATSRMTVAQRKIDILEGRIANFIAARTASLSEDE